MISSTCLPITDPQNQWRYCPSVVVALIFGILFLAVTIAHIAQSLRPFRPFCIVIIIGALWETAAFLFRILSAKSPTNKAAYDASFLLVLLAPVCINAFDYMIVSRIVKAFLLDGRVLGLKRSILGKLFVCSDLVSFVIQIAGGLMSLSKTTKTATHGIHIVEAGLIFQGALIIYFFCLTIRLIIILRHSMLHNATYRRLRLQINAVQFSLLLIMYRIIYRLVEFTSPPGSPRSNYIDGHEWTVYVFDAGPMFLAIIVMNIWHPGNALVKNNEI
ncbi:hypothetical protein BT63DRAFT_451448 [Microthyrium microscopicum]|uniref:RTA1-domain-containing protein n=1 Tax=Microthyrium microscopicum TaxID=703497 RepID=A0A6A6UM95_9PEZI|nr:hypothetical protein BT63DRAFT_451448 [Microthyrium microscopicum]